SLPPASLVSRFRSSQTFAAHSHANFGIKGTLASIMLLVPLLNPKFAIGLAASSCELRVRGTAPSSTNHPQHESHWRNSRGTRQILARYAPRGVEGGAGESLPFYGSCTPTRSGGAAAA